MHLWMVKIVIECIFLGSMFNRSLYFVMYFFLLLMALCLGGGFVGLCLGCTAYVGELFDPFFNRCVIRRDAGDVRIFEYVQLLDI